MDDFEQHLARALQHGGDAEPSSVGLADRARCRAQVRRRNRAATLTAAAVVVLAPATVLAAHQGGASRSVDTQAGGSPGTSSVPSALFTAGTGVRREFILYGCTPTYPPKTDKVRFVGSAVLVSVCRYDAEGRAVPSSDLDLVDSTSARVAIQDATREIDTTCPRPEDAPFVVMVAGSTRAVVDLERGCFSLGGTAYRLSDELRGYAEKS